MVKRGDNEYHVAYHCGKKVETIMKAGVTLFSSSPFNFATSKYLQSTYPTIWEDIKRYAVEHPYVVPYINANPDCALIWSGYIQDNLVFQMDCDYKCTTDIWEDVRQAIRFVGIDIEIKNGVPYFNGYSWYEGLYVPTGNNYSIEVVVEFENTSSSMMILHQPKETSAKIAKAGISGWGNINKTKGWNPVTIAPNTLYNVGVNQDRCVVNGVSQTSANSDFNFDLNTNSTTIGARNRDGSITLGLRGKIYSIRIYDRLLSEQEFIANQTIDMQRWNKNSI